VESFGYNGLQEQTSDTLTSASGATLASQAYGYDGDGNITSESTGGLLGSSSDTYGYDEAGRLASETADGTATAFGYDADGNLATDGSASNAYNAQDQLTSSTDGSSTTAYAYSLNGGLSSAAPPSGGAQEYSFDAYGEMASAGGDGRVRVVRHRGRHPGAVHGGREPVRVRGRQPADRDRPVGALGHR
jgi:YD repeat-containing protein